MTPDLDTPYWEDDDHEVDSDAGTDPLHDALLSNPDLREAYNAAVEGGLSSDEAHLYARRAVFGEDWEPSGPAQEALVEGSDTEKLYKADDWDFERVDDLLQEAHEKTVQWGVTEDSPDLSKAPGVWESQDQVPDFVLDALKNLIRAGGVVWSGGYEHLPPSAEATLKGVLEDKMTQPQGWSLQSLLGDLKDALGDVDVEDEYLLNILRNETSAVLNTAREEAYEESEGRRDEEYVYDWLGPQDHRTTPTCIAIKEEVEDRGGAVPMDELKQILYEKALQHADAEGTPERVDDWQPHYQCRHTMTRKVQSL